MSERQLPSAGLVEPLTQREQTILQYLAVGMTYHEIAKQEVLALNTVKWYVQQVYGKLGVNNRRQAQVRARELGLIPSESLSSHHPNESTRHSMKSLPTGTVTFLFTDIVGSTPLWESQPDLMAAALQIHHTVLRGVIDAHGGIVFKTVGDAFQTAFPTAPQALQAAISGQRALQSAPWNELGELKVRMGLHTGEAELDRGGDEYAVSHTKNRIGRIHSTAHGSQILLSAETKELVDHHLPEGVTLKDLGEHQLKGIGWLEHLYQVCVPDLPQDFPPLVTTITQPNNLPIQVTSFIGREKELTAVHRLLASHHLVTLTGSGGTGKSRLSLQVAAQCLERFPNGVWLVELAPLADSDLIPKTVASALNLPEIPGKTVREALVDFLRPKRLLLILDNCEHLLEACADLAYTLIRACPELTILASSREFLGVEGEAPYRVPPMSLPDAHHLPSLETLADYDAVHLFVERAQLAAPSFTLRKENAGILAHVVSRLDGIPLAIELAASRLRVLGIDQVAQRLDDTFRLLTGGSRSKLPRHQTLRACIDWSYNLLSEPERVLLRRLSVFAGSWRLRAAEQVCVQASEKSQPLYPQDILDLLSELVDKSLVIADNEDGGRRRYRMLETVRQYAHEKLVDEDESQAARDRHLAYYLNLVETLAPKIRGPEQIETLDQLEIELGNLRQALEWALHTDVKVELRLATSLQWFWHIRSRWSEGIKWLERGLAQVRKTTPEFLEDQARAILYAKALTALSFHRLMKWFQVDRLNLMQVEQGLKESERILRGVNLETHPEVRRYLAWSLIWQVYIYDHKGDTARALDLSQEAHSLFRAVGDLHGMDESLQCLCFAGLETDTHRRKQVTQEQLAVAQTSGDIERIAAANRMLGIACFANGDFFECFHAMERSQKLMLQVNNPIAIAMGYSLLGSSTLFLGNCSQTYQAYDQAIFNYRNLGFENQAALELASKCLPAMAEGKFEEAARMIEGAWDILRMSENQVFIGHVLIIRTRLARLDGNVSAARQHAKELVNHQDVPTAQRVLAWVELGHLALQQGDLAQAQEHFQEGLLTLRVSFLFTDISTVYIFDALALLAARQKRYELATRLFGSRWCRGYANLLSPIEKAWRDGDWTAMREELGEARFEALYEEGKSITYQQFIDLAQEVIGG